MGGRARFARSPFWLIDRREWKVENVIGFCGVSLLQS